MIYRRRAVIPFASYRNSRYLLYKGPFEDKAVLKFPMHYQQMSDKKPELPAREFGVRGGGKLVV